MRQWVRTWHAFGVVDIASDPALWKHPQVQRAFPTPIVGRVIDLLDDADRLLAPLERQPHTLSHLDTHRVNLFARLGDQGQDQTVVIDWSFLGTAAVGEDLGTQISCNLYGLNVGGRPSPSCSTWRTRRGSWQVRSRAETVWPKQWTL